MANLHIKADLKNRYALPFYRLCLTLDVGDTATCTIFDHHWPPGSRALAAPAPSKGRFSRPSTPAGRANCPRAPRGRSAARPREAGADCDRGSPAPVAVGVPRSLAT